MKTNANAKFDSLTVNTLLNNDSYADNFNGYYDNYAISNTAKPDEVLTNFRNFLINKKLSLLLENVAVNRNLFVGSSSDVSV
jgi:hypothetical protein